MSDYHTRHWSKSNHEGYCQLCQATLHSRDICTTTSNDILPLGTLEHQLLVCPSLNDAREKCKSLWKEYCGDKPEIWNLIEIIANVDIQPHLQFLLDPTCCPEVICAVQINGLGVLAHILYLTRTWCYSLHTRRKKLLKLYNII